MRSISPKYRTLLSRIMSNRQLWLIIIAIGVWIIVLQNFGLFSRTSGAQSVYVVGGDIDADVSGSVSIDGGSVEVEGGYVTIDGTVDVNDPISVWVNGGQISTW